MQLEILEAGTEEDPESFCINPSIYFGCCVCHYWDWASGACGGECHN